MATWSRLTAGVIGVGVGEAAGAALEPVMEPQKQQAWDDSRTKLLDLGMIAGLAAAGLITPQAAHTEGHRQGYSTDRVDRAIQATLTTPGMAELDKMLNRETITRALFNHSLAKHKVDPRYWDALYDLTNDKLSVADVAAAVQQGHLPNMGILPDVAAAVTPAQGAVTPEAPDQQPPSNVPLTQININPLTEAAADGYDEERLKVRANLAGLPPGAAELLQMWNRNLVDEESVDAGIREGHLKTKWAGAYKRMRWAVLSASEYANLYVRAWITKDEMYKGGALTGHTIDQMELLYRNRGRPLAPQQAATAWARDAPHPKIPGEPDRPGTFDYQDFEEAIRRSDVQTWYAPTLWHNRFAYPPLFQITRLVQAGAITPEVAAQWAHYQRYPAEVVDPLLTYWQGLGGTTADPHVQKAQNQLWTTTHRAYIAYEIDDATASSALAAAGVSQDAIPDVLLLWQEERGLVRKQLTPAQVRKAWKAAVTNPATGEPWTYDEAVQAMVDRGYSFNDAATFLGEA